METRRIGVLALILAASVLAQQLAGYKNVPLAVVLIVAAGLAFIWLLVSWLSDKTRHIESLAEQVNDYAVSLKQGPGSTFSESLFAKALEKDPNLVKAALEHLKKQSRARKGWHGDWEIDPPIRSKGDAGIYD